MVTGAWALSHVRGGDGQVPCSWQIPGLKKSHMKKLCCFNVRTVLSESSSFLALTVVKKPAEGNLMPDERKKRKKRVHQAKCSKRLRHSLRVPHTKLRGDNLSR